MTFKALAIDLDGTLLVGDDLSERNRLAVLAAHNAGFEIIIATARWRHMAQRIAAEIGINSPIIACSGAQVYLPETGEDIFDHRLPADFTRDLYELCNQHRCIATITVDDDVILKLDGEPDMSQMPAEMKWVAKLSPSDHAAPRIAAIQGSALNEEIKNTLKLKYADQVNIYDSIGPSGKIVITVTAKAANKGEALKVTCDHLGLSLAEVISFGDAENDMAMFGITGSAVAMGQAGDSVKSAAKVVTGTNIEDGVAMAIDRILKTGAP
jgi:Cof subfamily protein (haloacid dehalogenase superfamily)